MKNKTIIVAWFLALRTMLKNKKTLLIISLVLTMSFVSLTFFGSVINGVTEKFENQIISGSTGYVLVEPNDDEKYIANANNLVQKLQKLPLTQGVSKRLKIGASIDTDEISMSKVLIVINPDDEASVTSISKSVVKGDYLSAEDTNEILLGATLVKSMSTKTSTSKMLDVDVGDNVEVFFNNGVNEVFNVKGIYKSGANFNDGDVFITQKKINEVYPELSDFASEVSIKLPARGFEQEYKDQMISLLSVRDKISDWTQKTDRIEQFTGSLIMVNQVTYIMGILTAIATVYIIIFIDVLHKRKQIGILKAVGINKKAIMYSFVIQSFVYGVLGVLLGIIVIYAMKYYFMIFPMKMAIGKISMLINTKELMTSSLVLIVASVFAGLIPAYKASKENILDAIFGG